MIAVTTPTVFQSSVGAELREGAGEIDGLAATEVALKAVAPNITHLRCGFFFANLLFHGEDIERGTLPPTTLTAWAADHIRPSQNA